MQPASHRRETGAVLVQTALLLIILMLFVGLAVDVGKLYAERRHMQNAADAGALAGARAICFGGDAVEAATEYAVAYNGADSALVQIVDGYQVRVIATRATDVHFMGLADLLGFLGIDVVNVRAEAMAACGETTRLCGTFPIAFDKTTWDKIPCGAEFYVWDDDSVTEDMCTKCKCEDVIGSAASIGPGQRGWVRLPEPPPGYSTPGRCGGHCGTRDLKCWIENDYNGPINIGDCVPGKPGVDSAALHSAETREGDNLYVLIWDEGSCTNIVGNCTGDLYHIVDFGYVNFTEVDLKLTIPPRDGVHQNQCPKNAKVIRATKLCNYPAIPCGRTEGDPPTGGFRAVSLLE